MLDGLPKCLWRVSYVVNHRSNQYDHQKECKISSSYTGIRSSTITETDTPTLPSSLFTKHKNFIRIIRIPRPLLCKDIESLYGYRDPVMLISKLYRRWEVSISVRTDGTDIKTTLLHGQ